MRRVFSRLPLGLFLTISAQGFNFFVIFSVENFYVACSDVGTIEQLKVKLVDNPNDWWSGDEWTVDEVGEDIKRHW